MAKSADNGAENEYKKYMKSAEWREVRVKILQRDGNRCVCCGRTDNLSVHHSTYEHLFHEMDNMGDLVTLCRVCHNQIHTAKSNLGRFRKSKVLTTES